MYISLNSYTLYGLDAIKIQVEISVSPGLPKFEIIGMADAAIKESKERIFQSIISCGYKIPPGNITINLAPAEIKKKGTLFDLPIAVGILLSSNQVSSKLELDKTLIAGELSLQGVIRKIKGLFNAGILMRDEHLNHIICPFFGRNDLLYFKDINRYFVNSLSQCISIIEGEPIEESYEIVSENMDVKKNYEGIKQLDFSEVYGNEVAKRAIQLSVLGQLNILLIGPPGCGKTMLLRRMSRLLPELDEKDALDVTRIHSASEEVESTQFFKHAPFREVHNSISEVSLIGGGKHPSPGEISLAHKGVLLMDEFPEFNRRAIQLLRTPIERKEITIRRVNYSCTFPSDFILAAAMNPCLCGYYGDSYKMCQCRVDQIKNYYQKLSGPILDRIDIILYIDPPKKENLFKKSNVTTNLMLNELKKGFDFLKNNPDYLGIKNIDRVLEKNVFAQDIVAKAYEKGFISLRRLKSIIKTAMTYSIFEGRELQKDHIYYAMQICKVKWGEE